MPSGFHVDVVDDDTAFADLAGEWDALLHATPAASGFQCHAWASVCRAHALDGDRRLFTLVVRDGRTPVAIVPSEIRQGALSLIGAAVSNYLGPVYRPECLAETVSAVAAFLATERSVSLVDLRGLRERSPFLAAFANAPMSGWRPARLVETARCPYVDLTPGWDATAARHSSKARATWSRKRKMLERLGRVAFVELDAADAVPSALPAMFTLFRERWAGRHESGGFADRRRAFHERAAVALAEAGCLRVSLLTVDDEIVAYSYGVRAANVTSSYVLAHDNRLNPASPGLLLLLQLLEAACRRGDPQYDFSIGEEGYKEAWATASERVFRVVRARALSAAALDAGARALGNRVWVAARSIGWLRDLKREGLRRSVLRRASPRVVEEAPPVHTYRRRAAAPARMASTPSPSRADGAAMRADSAAVMDGTRRSRPAVGSTPSETPSAAAVSVQPLTYADMRRLLPPQLLDVAAPAGLRGDRPLAVWRAHDLLGVIFQAATQPRPRGGGRAVKSSAEEPVYRDPVPAPGRTLEEMVAALASSAALPRFTLLTTARLDGPYVEHFDPTHDDHVRPAASSAAAR